jgi:hypothetical protein
MCLSRQQPIYGSPELLADCIRFNSSRLCRSRSRTSFCSARASAEYSPCFQRARRDRASPSGVRGPVLAPPCMRHRPFAIARAHRSCTGRLLAPASYRRDLRQSGVGSASVHPRSLLFFPLESGLLVRRIGPDYTARDRAMFAAPALKHGFCEIRSWIVHELWVADFVWVPVTALE